MATSQDDFIPWIKYPDLTLERLVALKELLCTVRSDAVGLHEPSVGDGPWGLGCRVYERTCHAIVKAAEKLDWLKVLPDKEKKLRFTFAIGETPMRFYHGGATDPPSRYLIGSYAEIHHRQHPLEFGVPIDTILRLAVETDSTGCVSNVSVVEMDMDRTITGTYVIPSKSKLTIPLQTPSVDLPPPVISPLEKEGDKKREARDASGE
jgi:hypothetical protein